MPHRVEIQSATLPNQLTNQRLYPPEGGSVKATKVKCLIEPLSSDTVVEFLHKGFQATHRLYFDEEFSFQSTDRIVKMVEESKGRWVLSDRKFEVKGEVNVGEMDTLWIITAEEVK